MNGDALLEAINDQEPNEKVWEEAISLSELIQSHYSDVAAATLKALSRARHPDTFSALSTCLVEHLLEHDFSIFDALELGIRSGEDKYLYALSLCSKFGSSTERRNSERWDALLKECRGRLETYRVKLTAAN